MSKTTLNLLAGNLPCPPWRKAFWFLAFSAVFLTGGAWWAPNSYGADDEPLAASSQPTPLVGVAYQTGFEPEQGFSTSKELIGQAGWEGAGTGGNGIVSNYFVGQGQQAYVGYAEPLDPEEEGLWAWYPLGLENIDPHRPLRFTVQMEIEDSTNDIYDEFGWQFYNTVGRRLFEISFNNEDWSIWIQSGVGNWIDTGQSFENGQRYDLSVLMDFGRKQWSASLGDTLLATDQSLGSVGQLLDLGDIDAAWFFDDIGSSGDNFMLFADVRLVWASDMPEIATQPLSQTVAAGSDATFTAAGAGAAPLSYQWYFQSTPLAGATGTNLTIANVRPANLGDYRIVVSNQFGAATSQVATLMIQTPLLGVAYQTGFEPNEGFSPDADLAGQAGWRGEGSGGNGIVTNFFPGKGQQAYVGYAPPLNTNDELFLAWYPLNLANIAPARPLRFSVLMEIVDSSNDSYDAFQWVFYNTLGQKIFLIDFENSDWRIWSRSGTNNWIDTGRTFTNDQPYELSVLMDFERKRWSATLDEVVLAADQPLGSPGQTTDLGDIDATWMITTPGSPGDNYLLFDDFRVVWDADLPTVTIRTVDGKPELTISGTSGTVVEIERSSTMGQGNWRVVRQLTLTGAPQTWVDIETPASSPRFYRAVLK